MYRVESSEKKERVSLSGGGQGCFLEEKFLFKIFVVILLHRYLWKIYYKHIINQYLFLNKDKYTGAFNLLRYFVSYLLLEHWQATNRFLELLRASTLSHLFSIELLVHLGIWASCKGIGTLCTWTRSSTDYGLRASAVVDNLLRYLLWYICQMYRGPSHFTVNCSMTK